MNFKEWIKNNYFECHEPSTERQEDMKKAWAGCKKEVLKILTNNTRNYSDYALGYDFDAIDGKSIGEIEKL